MNENLLQKNIRELKGIGEARAKLLQKLNISTVYDLITYFPRDYEDRSIRKKIVELVDGETCSFLCVAKSVVTQRYVKKGMTIYKSVFQDETGLITAVWFNQPFVKNKIAKGNKYILHGKISKRGNEITVSSPIIEDFSSDHKSNESKFLPIYPLTKKLSSNVMRKIVKTALNLVESKIEDIIPDNIRNEYELSEINYAIQNIHFPKSNSDMSIARYRLVFEELLTFQIGLVSIKKLFHEKEKGIQFEIFKEETEEYINSMPFPLTGAQLRVIKEIEEDMSKPLVMNRLIQGDVGSGKTIVASVAILKAVKNKYQSALMVPTEILARQHYETISNLFTKLGLKIEILVGSQKKKEKQEVLGKLKSGEIDVVIGTHALLEENVEFNNLGLVITDEQHRFGVRQRKILSQKGENPDTLVMSATPIPRTLAFILYGDLDISIIDELPPGRKPIETFVVEESMRERINNFIIKKVSEGCQAYVVCPLVEASEKLEATAAEELLKRLVDKDLKGLRVGLVHGKMKPKDKEETMGRFIEGDIDVLVSTTVIEVGINVPNANLMIIENAERFGLSQLHQLRGRVGRGNEQAYCILYNQSKSKIAKSRMDVMQKTNDGFVISEKDLELRGPGEFFGTKQHGLPEFKIANLYKDMEILKKAQEASKKIIEESKNPSNCENVQYVEKLIKKFRYKIEDFSTI